MNVDTSFVVTGTNVGTATNKILFTTAPTLVPASTGILARGVMGSNFDFVTYNGTTGLTNGDFLFG